MENNNPTNGSGQGKFLNGFVLGLLIGVGATLLLSTKKGKKILRSISEDGLDGILERLEGTTEDLNEENNYEEEEAVEKPEEKPVARRFFRGIGRN